MNSRPRRADASPRSRSPKASAGVHPLCIVRNSLNSADGLRSSVPPTRRWPMCSASIKSPSIGGRQGIRNSAAPSSTARPRRMPRLRKASSIVPAGSEAPVYAPYVKHYPPDTNAALAWLSRRQPEKWKDRQEVNVTGTIAQRLAQMTSEERGAFARDLAEQARRRLIDAGVIIEHEPEPAPEIDPDDDDVS